MKRISMLLATAAMGLVLAACSDDAKDSAEEAAEDAKESIAKATGTEKSKALKTKPLMRKKKSKKRWIISTDVNG